MHTLNKERKRAYRIAKKMNNDPDFEMDPCHCHLRSAKGLLCYHDIIGDGEDALTKFELEDVHPHWRLSTSYSLKKAAKLVAENDMRMGGGGIAINEVVGLGTAPLQRQGMWWQERGRYTPLTLVLQIRPFVAAKILPPPCQPLPITFLYLLPHLPRKRRGKRGPSMYMQLCNAPQKVRP